MFYFKNMLLLKIGKINKLKFMNRALYSSVIIYLPSPTPKFQYLEHVKP